MKHLLGTYRIPVRESAVFFVDENPALIVADSDPGPRFFCASTVVGTDR